MFNLSLESILNVNDDLQKKFYNFLFTKVSV